MNELERQYLRAAYDLAMDDPRRIFNEDEIANHLDLDTSLPDYADRFIGITGDLMGRGYIAPDSKGGGMGRRTLRLTTAGMVEAKRLADPIEQRKRLRRDLLLAIYEQANGSPTEFVYWRDLAPRYGLADMEMPPDSIMGVVDQLAGSGFITNEVEEGISCRITAKGIDEVEGNRNESQPSVTNTFNMSGTFYQAAVGTHNTNAFSGDLDFSTVERHIEEEGGADKEELHELVAEMRDLLESGQTLDKGSLARFNDKLKQVPWLAGPVAGWLLNFATQEVGQHLG